MSFTQELSRSLFRARRLALVLVLGSSACRDNPTQGLSESPLAPSADLAASSTRVGDRVRATHLAYIRSGPSVRTSLAGTQPVGAVGTIVEGPVADSTGDRLTRWLIDFDTGVDGWGAHPYFDKLALAGSSISLTPAESTVSVGSTVQLTVHDASGSEMPAEGVQWSSDAPAVATVSSTGLVTSVASGTAKIAATNGDLTGVAIITVASTRFVRGDRVRSGGKANIRTGPEEASTLLGAQPAGALGTVLGGPVIDVGGDELERWWIDFDSGPDGWAAEPYVSLTKVQAAAPVATVTVMPTALSLEIGETAQLSATVNDSVGTAISNAAITWLSRDSTRVKVSPTGLVAASAAGAAYVIVTSDGKTDSALVTVTASAAARAGYYVAPGGSSGGDGSLERPWDLATGLRGGGGRVQPGDTVWVRGGTYRGSFTSTVSGTAGRPVVIRGYPGERAILDGAGQGLTTTLGVTGEWSVIWGLEVTNSDPDRTAERPHPLVNHASNTKYVNLVVHDGGVAFYTYTEHRHVEVYGTIFYNNGWQESDRGHGHALYVKSDVGPVLLKDNVMFNQFGWGVHVYTNAGSGKLNNIRVEGNVAFNNGTLSTNSTAANILVGGHDYATGDTIVNNFTYLSPGVSGRNMHVGYSTLANGTVVVRDNYLAGGNPVLEMGYWEQATVSGNTLIGTARMVRLNDNTLSGYTWGGDRYHRDPLSLAWMVGGTAHPWLLWQTLTGLGLSDLVTPSTPSAPRVHVRPNQYEPGRATVVVYNWTRQGSVAVDLAGVLETGDRYAVHSVQDLFGAPVASGTFAGGSITIPMTGVTPPTPVGLAASRSPTTGPDFDTFIVTRR